MVNSAGHGDSDPHASGGDALKCRLRLLACRAGEAREFDWVAEVPWRECGKKSRRGGTGQDLARCIFELDQYGREAQTMMDSIFSNGHGMHGPGQRAELRIPVVSRIRNDADCLRLFLRIPVV
jgi:hypothetical protein